MLEMNAISFDIASTQEIIVQTWHEQTLITFSVGHSSGSFHQLVQNRREFCFVGGAARLKNKLLALEKVAVAFILSSKKSDIPSDLAVMAASAVVFRQ